MTLTLKLPPDVEQRLIETAQQHGVAADAFALTLLDQHLPTAERQQLADLIQSWIDDESEHAEQKETGDYLVRVLDEDRTSERKLFPPELEGITW